MALRSYVPHDQPGKFWCLECRTGLPLELHAPGTPYCLECLAVIEHRKALGKQQGLLRQAATNVLDLVAQYDTTQGPNDTLVDRFLQTFGPQEAGEAAADICRSVMAAARGSTDPKALREARTWFFKLQSVTERYQKQIEDRRKGLSDLSMEDLLALLRPLCIEMCRQDPQFLHEVMGAAQPDWVLEAERITHTDALEPTGAM